MSDEPSQQVFRLSPAYFTRLKRRMLWAGLAIIPAAIAIQVLTERGTTTPGGTDSSTIFAWTFVTLIVAIALYVSYRKQVARWQTFRIAVTSDEIIRTQEGYKEVRVSASSISRSVKDPARGLCLYAGRSQPAIIIPETLERFEDCSNLIQRFRPIDVGARTFPTWARIAAGLAVLGLYIAYERATDPRVTVGLGVLMAAAFAIAAWRLYGNPDTDRWTKRHFAWVLAGLVASFGLQIWSTWNAPRRTDQAIQNDRILSLLVKAKPEMRDRLRDAMIAEEKKARDGGTHANPAARVTVGLLPEYLAICSDAAVIRYARETVTLLERLEADPSDICYRWLYPGGQRVDLEGVIGQDDPMEDAMTEVFESALETPQAVPDASEVEPLRARVLEKVTNDPELHPPGLPQTDKKRACLTVERTFKAALDLPGNQSGLLLRYMFSKAKK